MSVVVDSSVVVALLVAEEKQASARMHVERWLRVGQGLHAPAVLPFEVANVLARLVFDGVLAIDQVPEIWRDVAALGLVLHPFEAVVDGPDVAAVTATLRRRHATDSTYVCLARKLGTEVWTLDRALARNAADAGLPVQLVS
ncbi:MAG: type II toxin-antitoxin system VapC family toxin [Frankiaceae bacterium]